MQKIKTKFKNALNYVNQIEKYSKYLYLTFVNNVDNCKSECFKFENFQYVDKSVNMELVYVIYIQIVNLSDYSDGR
jgi:hypothetical protein